MCYMAFFWLMSGSRVPMLAQECIQHSYMALSFPDFLCRTAPPSLHLQLRHVLSHQELLDFTELHYCFHDKLPVSLTMFLEVFRSTSPQITFPYNLYIGTVSFFSAVYDCQMLPAASQKKPRVLEPRALHHSTHACAICCQWAFFTLCVEMNTFA